MALVITQVGLDKAIDADTQGISLKVTHVGVGLNGYAPSKSQTSLQNELERIEISGGKKISSTQIHLTALFDGDDEIIGREIGFYLEDGTLFAVDSDPDTIIMYKSGSNGSRALEAFDLILDSVPADSITVDVTGDLILNFDTQFNALQFAPYDPDRRYKTGEICTIEVDGEVIAMQMYAGPNMTCINKNPADLSNRHEQWFGAPEPFWWIPYTGNIAGQMSGWLSETIPESAVLENEVDLNAKLYWRLALAWPELVTGDGDAAIINTRDILGRFVRTADGVKYPLNTTHEDAIRNISGYLNGIHNFSGSAGVFDRSGNYASISSATENGGGSIIFDASNVVPTAAQNQPVATIENKIVFI